jgi:hypothetical protein
MRVLFLKPKRVPVEVVMRLNQYAHERKLRLEGYEAKWERLWAEQEQAAASAARERYYVVGR